MAYKGRGILFAAGLSGLLAIAATTVGCGDSGGGNNDAGVTDPFAEFTGTWAYTESQATYTCPNQTPFTANNFAMTKLLAAGVAADIVDLTPAIFDPTTDCFYGFDVKDKIATIQASQTCSFTDLTDANGNPISIEEVPTSWTFTLTSATTAEEVFSLSEATCTLTGMATLKKIAKN